MTVGVHDDLSKFLLCQNDVSGYSRYTCKYIYIISLLFPFPSSSSLHCVQVAARARRRRARWSRSPRGPTRALFRPSSKAAMVMVMVMFTATTRRACPFRQALALPTMPAATPASKSPIPYPPRTHRIARMLPFQRAQGLRRPSSRSITPITDVVLLPTMARALIPARRPNKRAHAPRPSPGKWIGEASQKS